MLLGSVATGFAVDNHPLPVAVKQEVGGASLGLSPKRAQDEIRAGVEQAVRNRAQAKPSRRFAV